MRNPETPQEISVSHTMKVRYADTDQMGVVYHANYIVWFHEARDALLEKIGINVVALEKEGYSFPIVDISCRYLLSARYGDQVTVTAHLLRERIARMRFRFEVVQTRSKRLLATGHTVSVITDLEGKLLIRMPKKVEKLIFDRSEVKQLSDQIEEFKL